MKIKVRRPVSWYNQRGVAAVIAIAALTIAYFLGSRALDTGSLQQYALMGVLIIVGSKAVGVLLPRVAFKKRHGEG